MIPKPHYCLQVEDCSFPSTIIEVHFLEYYFSGLMIEDSLQLSSLPIVSSSYRFTSNEFVISVKILSSTNQHKTPMFEYFEYCLVDSCACSFPIILSSITSLLCYLGHHYEVDEILILFKLLLAQDLHSFILDHSLNYSIQSISDAAPDDSILTVLFFT